jgi:Mn2+/Fe2+ NRAMP family transporter
MAAIQEASAWIGRVTGAGLARNLKLHYPRWISYAVVSLLFIVNVINLAADIGAMADALCLIVGGPIILYSVMFGVMCLAGEVFISSAKFAKILKWGILVLFVYLAVAFVVRIPLRDVLAGSLMPTIRFNDGYMTALTVRFLIGGLFVSTFAVFGDCLKPKSIARLFGAAPSVTLATLSGPFMVKALLTPQPKSDR